MIKFMLRMPTRANYLSANDIAGVFRLLDKDGSGMLNGDEVQDMFNQICGVEVSVNGGMGEYSLKQFQCVVEDTEARYPQFKVAENLMNYLKENGQSEGDDADPLSLANCEKLFGIMDGDGTGELDVNEIIKMFRFIKMTGMEWAESFMEFGTLTSAEELQACLKSMDEKYPSKNIDEGVVNFLAQAAEAGGKPDLDGVEEVPQVEPDEVGKRKALLVGINYYGTSSELGGCINDVRNQMAVLMENFGFEEENILLLTEDQDDEEKMPTKEKIMAGFDWLLGDVEPGDELFFQYSGHGSQMPDRSGTESDGKNECLCPVDCHAGPWPDYVILDNDIYDIFYNRLADGVKCVCVFDCCHSGTMADLQCTRAMKPPVCEDDAGDDGSRWMDPPEDMKEELEGMEPSGEREVADRSATSPEKQVWTFSGCQDHQTSADATIDGQRQGALTWGFIKALKDCGWRASYSDLLNATRKNLKGRFTQIPGLSTTCDEYVDHYYLETK